ncbi:MAG: tetratricopeptide repeat protein [Planctomycetes bacterium]|nr:tetratricopeptide repeat protein [Planctomycetota bacterium]
MSFRSVGCALVIGCLVACSGLPPTAAEFAANLPAERELSVVERERVEGHVADAIAYLESGDHIGAAGAAASALVLDPRQARALAVQALAELRRSEADTPVPLDVLHRTEGELLQASTLAPEDPVVGFLHADYLRRVGHLTAAAQRAESALDSAPEHVDLLELAGRLRYDLGDERRAIPHLTRLVELDPRNAKAWYRLAESRIAVAMAARDETPRVEAAQGAADAFERYIALAPADAAGHLGLAHALVLVGTSETLERAVDSTEIAARLDARSPDPRFDQGVVLDLLGHADAARVAYEAALRRDGDHVPSLLNLAANQAQASLLDDARATCRRVLLLDLGREDRRRVETWLRDNAEPDHSIKRR